MIGNKNTISVIISTYTTERLELLKKCIESVRHQTIPPHEIILVLDSDDELLEFYRTNLKKDVIVLDSGGQGLSSARNAGIKKSKSNIVAFIDDDAYADDKWLENLTKHYDDMNIIASGGAIKPQWDGGRPYWFAEELDWTIGCTYKGFPEVLSFVRNPIGCNMSYRKEIFEKIGYFKTNIGRYKKKLLSGEEMELSSRALKNIPNSYIIFDPTSIVHHNVPINRSKYQYVIKRCYYEGYSKAFIAEENKNTLRTENTYLKYLLMRSLPNRMLKIYKIDKLSQLLVIITSILSVGIGFLRGSFEKKMSINN